MALPRHLTARLRVTADLAAHRAYSTAPDTLAGTVAYHTAYILLHTHTPPPSFPSRVSSKVQRSLQLQTARWGGLVNHAWHPDETTTARDPEQQPEWELGPEEAYRVTAFSVARGRIEIPQVSLKNVAEVAAALRAHADPEAEAGYAATHDDGKVYLYVCTHGERDCRCGETGGAVFDAVRRRVEELGLTETVKVGGVGHVGGHKYAANMLVFPHGEWLGDLKPEHVPAVLDKIVQAKFSSFSTERSQPLLPSYWRGRMGLDKEEQLNLVSPPHPPPSLELLKPHSSRE